MNKAHTSEKPLIAHTQHIQKAAATLSSVSHIQILYIVCHVHINDCGWCAALPHCGILSTIQTLGTALQVKQRDCPTKILCSCVHQLKCMIEGKCAQMMFSYFHNKISRCWFYGQVSKTSNFFQLVSHLWTCLWIFSVNAVD